MDSSEQQSPRLRERLGRLIKREDQGKAIEHKETNLGQALDAIVERLQGSKLGVPRQVGQEFKSLAREFQIASRQNQRLTPEDFLRERGMSQDEAFLIPIGGWTNPAEAVREGGSLSDENMAEILGVGRGEIRRSFQELDDVPYARTVRAKEKTIKLSYHGGALARPDENNAAASLITVKTEAGAGSLGGRTLGAALEVPQKTLAAWLLVSK